MNEDGAQGLRAERLRLKGELSEEETQEVQGLELSLRELRERIALCEDGLRFNR